MCQVVCEKLDSILLSPEGGGFISLETFIIFFREMKTQAFIKNDSK